MGKTDLKLVFFDILKELSLTFCLSFLTLMLDYKVSLHFRMNSVIIIEEKVC